MKKLLIILLSFASLLVYTQQIVQAEYFYDEDPGYGNALSISINNSSEIEINEYLSTTELNPGFHTFHIRFKDENNQWSPVLSKGFYIEKNNAVLYNIETAEYFFDEDPGVGQGNNISLTNSQEIEINEMIEIDELDPGFHTFHLRFKDENNNWSSVLTKGFYKELNGGLAIPIDYIEYFYDTDPGYGNAIPYTSFSASTNLTETFFADVAGLNEGTHEFNIRLKNEIEQWSQTYSQEFELLNCDLELSGIVTHEDQTPVNDGKIILFQYFGEGAAIGVDTLALTDGSYKFENVCPMSEYFLKVIPESTSDYPPCYYGNTIYWQQATTIVTEQSSVSGVDIIVYDFADMESGTSTIGGHIYYADSKGEPVKNVDVVLEYDAPERNEDYEAVAYNRSNDLGEWIMEDLPNGSFRIKVEIPGLSMDTTYYINITNAGTVIDNLDFYVDMNTGIYIDHFGIDEYLLSEELTIFPNPVTDHNVWIKSLNQNIIIEEITIYNYVGQQINQIQIHDQVALIENNSWSKGFYLVKIKTNKGLLIKKMIAQ